MSQRSTPSTDNIKLAAIPESILTASPSSWLHRFRDWISDRFSSIMVKEARQALKSYQFFITYTIVIVAVAAWTLLMFFGDTVSSHSANWDELSKNLFFGYCVILGVPLCLIVPFSAFRSLAREYEDGTIQLISITTMKPYQIVLGKLSTAMLQMAIYLSIIAPCIALTYMLDGISYALIGIVLLIATGGSIFLTILGLLLAGASRSYAIGMGISVFFVLGLGGLYLFWLGLLTEMIHGYGFNSNEFLRPEGQIAIYGTTACLGSIALVMLAAAAAQISFDSDNRSTTIRIAMLVQMTLFLGLVAMAASVNANLEVLLVIAVFAGHFWLIAGCMLVSEKLGLSDRVQRTLPKTWFGRSFFSLLLPGPGRGYLFTVSCLIATVLASAAIIMSTNWYAMPSSFSLYSRPFQQAWIEALGASAIASLYPLFFLSLVYLWMYLLRRHGRLKTTGALGPFIGLLSGILFVSSISILAFALWFNFERPLGTNYYSSSEPSIFRCFNWYLAIESIGSDLFSTGSVLRVSNLIFFLPFLIVAAATTLTATLIAIRELRYQPTAAPIRVIEEVERDEAERYAVPAAPAGESIDEIFGALPDKKPPTDAE